MNPNNTNNNTVPPRSIVISEKDVGPFNTQINKYLSEGWVQHGNIIFEQGNGHRERQYIVQLVQNFSKCNR